MTKRRKKAPATRNPEFVHPLDVQVGGDHYKDMKSQPIQYILLNDLNYVEGRVTEYMARWRKKNGVSDLEKARHLLDIAIEHHKNEN